MAVYSVEGKLGTGKTKFAVWMAQQALLQGRRVSSNVDIKAERLCPYKARPLWTRIPDKPNAADLMAMGHGNPDSYNEDRNGVLILDELGTWLNTRSFQDKSRAPMIDWLIHARKHGWDVFLVVQDATMIDKQVREALIEYQARCMNWSRIKVPIVGSILGLFNDRWGYLPRMHSVTARTGYGQNAIIAERWLYKGEDLHAAYDTRQVFTDDYPHGTHTVLPPWDHVPAQTPMQRLRERLSSVFRPRTVTRPPLRPKLHAIALAQGLPPAQRMAVASRYVRSLDRRAA